MIIIILYLILLIIVLIYNHYFSRSIYNSSSDYLPIINNENKQLPIFFSCGTGDPVVSYSLSKKSIDIFKSVCGNNIIINKCQRAKHNMTTHEMESAQQFIKSHLYL